MKTSYEVLVDLAEKLKKAGAKLPIENKGTMESAHKGGLSIALVLVEDALASMSPTEVPEKTQDILTAIDDYANGKIILLELLHHVGLPWPKEKQVRSLAYRVTELEEENRALQERVAFAERDRDAASAAADEVKQKAKEKAARAGEHISKIIKTARLYYQKTLVEADVVKAVMDVASDLGVKPPADYCPHCRAGIVETGSNDLPCEHCVKGKTAVFSDGQTGEDVFRSYNSPRPMPDAWS